MIWSLFDCLDLTSMLTNIGGRNLPVKLIFPKMHATVLYLAVMEVVYNSYNVMIMANSGKEIRSYE